MLDLLWQILFHPLSGMGYQFWSGIGANLTVLGVIYSLYKQSRCHEIGCRRRAWRAHPLHGYQVCRVHYPKDKIPEVEQQEAEVDD